ncbi:MAG TPA: LysR family transcriptional regulator, partial [Stellaceae bacterium]|nr:LysR family transcriptional regulator [Stellaceae bacterium]
AFVRVAENGGFSAAARSLNVSPTTVSDQVQALETALGVRLLSRTTRHVSLTEVGREYYERCTQILHELEEADQAASALQQTPRGQLRVYCHQGLAPPVGAVVAGFLATHQETSVDLRTGEAKLCVSAGSPDQVSAGEMFRPLPPPPMPLPKSARASCLLDNGFQLFTQPPPLLRSPGIRAREAPVGFGLT